MKLIRHPYFLLMLMLYGFIRLARHHELINGWLNDHVTDLICIPIVLSIILPIVQFLKKDKNLVFPWYSVAFVVIYWSVYFEYYLPLHSNAYTADILDVLMYIIGGLFFFFWQSRVVKKQMPLHHEYLPLEKENN